MFSLFAWYNVNAAIVLGPIGGIGIKLLRENMRKDTDFLMQQFSKATLDLFAYVCNHPGESPGVAFKSPFKF